MFRKAIANLARTLLNPLRNERGEAGGGNAGVVEPPAWMAQLEGDLQKSDALTGFQSISELAKAHLETGERVRTLEEAGKGMVKVPGEGAAGEEIAAFNRAIGVPDNPDAYTFGKPETTPEDFAYDNDFEKEFRAGAHAAGVNDRAAKAMYSTVMSGLMSRFEAHNKAISDELATEQDSKDKALADMWGDKTEENKTAATRLIEGYKEGKAFATLQKYGLHDHPDLLELFHDIRMSIAPDNIIPGGPGSDDSPEAKLRAFFPNSGSMFKE